MPLTFFIHYISLVFHTLFHSFLQNIMMSYSETILTAQIERAALYLLVFLAIIHPSLLRHENSHGTKQDKRAYKATSSHLMYYYSW